MTSRNDQYLTVAEISKIQKVSPVTIYEWIKKGLKTEKELISGTRHRHMIKLKDVKEFIKRGSK